jgi:hypothetical protein
MNKLACCAATLVVLGAGAAGLAGSACTVTSSSGDDGGISTGYDSGNQPDVSTGGGGDAGEPDTGTGGQDSAADGGGGGCTVGVTTGVPACDTCVGNSCCSQLTACSTPDDAGADDAGITACLMLVGCIQDCIQGSDAAPPGDAADCVGECSPSYSQTEREQALQLLSCVGGSCSTQCGQ